MGAFKSVWTQAAVYPTEAQTQEDVVYGPLGNNFTGTLVVGGSAPTTPGTLIGQIVTLNEQGATEAGADVSVQIIEGPGDAGIAYDSAVWTVTSDSDGLAEFDGIVPRATYRLWRGGLKTAYTFTAPEIDDDVVVSGRFDIDEVIGADE